MTVSFTPTSVLPAISGPVAAARSAFTPAFGQADGGEDSFDRPDGARLPERDLVAASHRLTDALRADDIPPVQAAADAGKALAQYNCAMSFLYSPELREQAVAEAAAPLTALANQLDAEQARRPLPGAVIAEALRQEIPGRYRWPLVGRVLRVFASPEERTTWNNNENMANALKKIDTVGELTHELGHFQNTVMQKTMMAATQNPQRHNEATNGDRQASEDEALVQEKLKENWQREQSGNTDDTKVSVKAVSVAPKQEPRRPASTGDDEKALKKQMEALQQQERDGHNRLVQAWKELTERVSNDRDTVMGEYRKLATGVQQELRKDWQDLREARRQHESDVRRYSSASQQRQTDTSERTLYVTNNTQPVEYFGAYDSWDCSDYAPYRDWYRNRTVRHWRG